MASYCVTHGWIGPTVKAKTSHTQYGLWSKSVDTHNLREKPWKVHCIESKSYMYYHSDKIFDITYWDKKSSWTEEIKKMSNSNFTFFSEGIKT